MTCNSDLKVVLLLDVKYIKKNATFHRNVEHFDKIQITNVTVAFCLSLVL